MALVWDIIWKYEKNWSDKKIGRNIFVGEKKNVKSWCLVAGVDCVNVQSQFITLNLFIILVLMDTTTHNKCFFSSVLHLFLYYATLNIDHKK